MRGRLGRTRKPGVDELVELGLERLLAEQLLEQARAHRAAEHRGEAQRRLRLRRQPIDARRDDVARGRRDVVAGLAHGLRELFDEQRVAAAARDHGRDVERRRGIAEPIRDQRAQLAADEIADADHDIDGGRLRTLGTRGQHAAARGRAR